MVGCIHKIRLEVSLRVGLRSLRAFAWLFQAEQAKVGEDQGPAHQITGVSLSGPALQPDREF